jgi:hypothetical protein
MEVLYGKIAVNDRTFGRSFRDRNYIEAADGGVGDPTDRLVWCAFSTEIVTCT